MKINILRFPTKMSKNSLRFPTKMFAKNILRFDRFFSTKTRGPMHKYRCPLNVGNSSKLCMRSRSASEFFAVHLHYLSLTFYVIPGERKPFEHSNCTLFDMGPDILKSLAARTYGNFYLVIKNGQRREKPLSSEKGSK